jgi:hypothetical protein
MTLDEAVDQMKTTCSHPCQIELLERILNPPAERELAARIPLYPHRTAKRESLCQLRWIHLQSVSTMARSNDNRADLFRVLRKNYEHFFGRLRKRRQDEVPSDELRKDFIVHNILNQVDAYRARLEEEAAYAAST